LTSCLDSEKHLLKGRPGADATGGTAAGLTAAAGTAAAAGRRRPRRTAAGRR